MIALYAITSHPTPPLPELHSVQIIASEGLAALCGPVTDEALSAESLWRHERIVEALMEARDLLPVRFGTHLPDKAAAVEVLRDKRLEFETSLSIVRGGVELAVRVFAAAGDSGAPVPAPAAAAAGVSGTDYLRARARTVAGEAEAERIVHAPLAGLARAATVARGHRAGELLCAAYLVDRDAAQSFSTRVRDLQSQNPRLRITCTGPWPPYSFVSS